MFLPHPSVANGAVLTSVFLTLLNGWGCFVLFVLYSSNLDRNRTERNSVFCWVRAENVVVWSVLAHLAPEKEIQQPHLRPSVTWYWCSPPEVRLFWVCVTLNVMCSPSAGCSPQRAALCRAVLINMEGLEAVLGFALCLFYCLTDCSGARSVCQVQPRNVHEEIFLATARQNIKHVKILWCK